MPQPSCAAYDAVILACSNSKQPDAAERSDRLLSELWFVYNNTQDELHLLSQYLKQPSYNCVIMTWACSEQSKIAAMRAKELLEEMEAFYRECQNIAWPNNCMC
jgi:hypothetical protein